MPANTSEWVDCSQPMVAGMSQPAGTPCYELRGVREMSTHGMSMQSVRLLTHLGTHVDAPAHFFGGAADIDSVDLAATVGPGVTVAVPAPALGPIGASDIEVAGGVGHGAIVLIRTGWSRYYGGPDYERSPFLTAAAAEYLLAHRVRALGVDTISPDEPPHRGRAESFDYPVHRLLLGAGVPIIENLDLSRVPAGRCDVVAAPLRIVGGDGAPARVIVRPAGDDTT